MFFGDLRAGEVRFGDALLTQLCRDVRLRKALDLPEGGSADPEMDSLFRGIFSSTSHVAAFLLTLSRSLIREEAKEAVREFNRLLFAKAPKPDLAAAVEGEVLIRLIAARACDALSVSRLRFVCAFLQGLGSVNEKSVKAPMFYVNDFHSRQQNPSKWAVQLDVPEFGRVCASVLEKVRGACRGGRVRLEFEDGLVLSYFFKMNIKRADRADAEIDEDTVLVPTQVSQQNTSWTSTSETPPDPVEMPTAQAFVAAAVSPFLWVGVDEQLAGASRLITPELPDFLTFFELLDTGERRELFAQLEARFTELDLPALFADLSPRSRSRAFSAALTDPLELQLTEEVSFAPDVLEAVRAALALPDDAARLERFFVTPDPVDVPDELLPLVVLGLTIVMDRSAWDRLLGVLEGVLRASQGGRRPGEIAGVTGLAAQLQRAALRPICAEYAANYAHLPEVVSRLHLAQVIAELDLAELFGKLPRATQARVFARNVVPRPDEIALGLHGTFALDIVLGNGDKLFPNGGLRWVNGEWLPGVVDSGRGPGKTPAAGVAGWERSIRLAISGSEGASRPLGGLMNEALSRVPRARSFMQVLRCLGAMGGAPTAFTIWFLGESSLDFLRPLEPRKPISEADARARGPESIVAGATAAVAGIVAEHAALKTKKREWAALGYADASAWTEAKECVGAWGAVVTRRVESFVQMAWPICVPEQEPEAQRACVLI
jgi:hypothetical protein